MQNFKFLAILVLFSFCAVANARKMINCYYGTWANYREGIGKFDASNIDPNSCTHISYAFFGIQPNGEFTILDRWLDLDSGLGMIRKTMALKHINPDLKVLAVVGGWNEGSLKYSKMASDPNMRKVFINSSLKFIREYGFDGLDIDWEYPAQRDGAPIDKQNFVTLLKELKEALTPFNLQLGIATGAAESSAAKSYDIPNISKYVDFINVMTYDFHNPNTLSYNSPLRGQGENSVESAIKYWLRAGAPASKLIMGVAFYGRHFGYSQQPSAGSPQTGAGVPGPFTKEAGYLSYYEICKLGQSGYTFKFDDNHGVPYAYNNNQWIGYDNAKSIEMKVQFANSLNLGGVMAWSLESDDFRGECGQKYVLLNTVSRTLDQGNTNGQLNSNPQIPLEVVTKKPEVVTSAPAVQNPSETGAECRSDGTFVNEADCGRFYRCVGGLRHDYACPGGLQFDTVAETCTWPEMANCGQ